jgi:hypothetical protein
VVHSGRPEPDASYEPGVIDHGALAVLGLAAMRVATDGNQTLFVNTVHGLALSAAPAEVLGRLAPRVPDPDDLSIILGTLYLLDSVGSALKAPLLRPFASDPAERSRWRCLAQLFEKNLPDAVGEAHRRANLGSEGGPIWDGGYSSVVHSVRPDRAPVGATVVLSGPLASRMGRASKQGGLPAGIQVVFAAPDRAPVAAKVLGSMLPARKEPRDGRESREKKETNQSVELHVQVPEGATPGWVGFSDDQRIDDSNRFRSALAEILPKMGGAHGCMGGANTDLLAVPLIGHPDPGRPGKRLAIPPRSSGNRWYARPEPGAAAMTSGTSGRAIATASFSNATSGVPVNGDSIEEMPTTAVVLPRIVALRELQWAGESPRWFGVDLEIEVLVDLPVPRKVDVSLVLDPPAAEGAAPVALASTDSRFRFVVPGKSVVDGIAVTAVLTDATGRGLDRKTAGPLALRAPRPLRLVLLSPRVIDPPRSPLDAAGVAQGLVAFAARLGLRVEVVELPWVDDELAVLLSPPVSPSDGRIDALLESLSRRAMLSPGLEDALWLLLIPPDPPAPSPEPTPKEAPPFARIAGYAWPVGSVAPLPIALEGSRLATNLGAIGFFRMVPGPAARWLAIADVPGMVRLLTRFPAEAEVSLVSAPIPRLRLMGSFDGAHIVLEPTVQQTRDAGPGGPFDSGIVAVAVDAQGRELSTARMTCLRRERPAQAAALLAVPPDTAAIELRRSGDAIHRIVRTAGEPQLALARLSSPRILEPQGLAWSFRHTRNARPVPFLVLGREGIATEVERFDACEPKPVLHLARYASATRVQLSASDGWNEARLAVIDSDGRRPATIDNPHPVRVRRLSDGRFFADVPAQATINWTFDGEARGSAALLDLEGEEGVLRLEASLGTGSPLIDERMVERQ